MKIPEDACENRFFKQLLIWYRKDGFEITVLHLHSNLQTCWEASTKYLVDIRTTKRQITWLKLEFQDIPVQIITSV